MKTFLIVYKDEYPKYDIQKVEGYWDLSYEYEPNIIIEIDEELLEKLKKLESQV